MKTRLLAGGSRKHLSSSARPGYQFATASCSLIRAVGEAASDRTSSSSGRSRSHRRTRIDITTDGAPCNAEYKPYTGIVR